MVGEGPELLLDASVGRDVVCRVEDWSGPADRAKTTVSSGQLAQRNTMLVPQGSRTTFLWIVPAHQLVLDRRTMAGLGCELKDRVAGCSRLHLSALPRVAAVDFSDGGDGDQAEPARGSRGRDPRGETRDRQSATSLSAGLPTHQDLFMCHGCAIVIPTAKPAGDVRYTGRHRRLDNVLRRRRAKPAR